MKMNIEVGGTHLHMNGFTYRLVLTQRQKELGNGLLIRCSIHKHTIFCMPVQVYSLATSDFLHKLYYDCWTTSGSVGNQIRHSVMPLHMGQIMHETTYTCTACTVQL